MNTEPPTRHTEPPTRLSLLNQLFRAVVECLGVLAGAEIEALEEMVQSTDIFAFNKV